MEYLTALPISFLERMKMDNNLKEKLIKDFRKLKLHAKIGEEMKKHLKPKYKKQIRKIDYLVRRGERTKTRLTQLQSIPFLSKEI